MKRRDRGPRVLAMVMAMASAVPAVAGTFDAFENGKNPNLWSFNVTTPDYLPTTGGTPGGWLYNPLVVSYTPRLTADLRDLPADNVLKQAFARRQVSRISLDARTLWSEFPTGLRPFALMLKSTNGTPGVIEDDDFVYTLAPAAPLPGGDWTHYSFSIPSRYTGYLPPGWIGGRYDDFEQFRPGKNWNTVIGKVDIVQFWWADPRGYYLVHGYSVGADNIAIDTFTSLPGPSP